MIMGKKNITYERFVARNNEVKQRLKSLNGADRILRVTHIDPAVNGGYKKAIVRFDGHKPMTAFELIYAVMNGNGAISNPSKFDGWGGWTHDGESSPKKTSFKIMAGWATLCDRYIEGYVSKKEWSSKGFPIFDFDVVYQGGKRKGSFYICKSDVEEYLRRPLTKQELDGNDDACYGLFESLINNEQAMNTMAMRVLNKSGFKF